MPAVAARWLDGLLPGSIPRETAATCESCAMCDGDRFADRRDVWLFDPRTKCCTYHPDLANFAVGAILADPDPALAPAREVIAARFTTGEGVGPLGINAPEEYLRRFRENEVRFGRRADLLCPFYVTETGHCGIRRHRPGVCATWFCKHDRGAVGARFWEALRDLLDALEKRLACRCAAALGARGSGPEGEPPSWGPWEGRPAEYFRACAVVAGTIDGDVLIRAGDTEAERRVGDLLGAYRSLTDRGLPERIGPGSFEITGRTDGRSRVVGYSPRDPLDIPSWVMETLDAFDGSPTGDALARAAGRTGRWIPSTLVRKLVDFGILHGAEEEAGSGILERR